MTRATPIVGLIHELALRHCRANSTWLRASQSNFSSGADSEAFFNLTTPILPRFASIPAISPYILLLLAESSGNYCVYHPSEGYQVVFTWWPGYEEAENWLLEDEFEPVEGRLSPVEI
ncbi:MAG UNVERIFIED_CONTAM: hypothetical protein LVR29_32910 [Microcystis novacekii LVE1205-3]